MTEREELLNDAEHAIVSALSELSAAHTLALDAEDFMLAADISKAMAVLEAALGLAPPPRPTHRATEAVQ